MKLTREKLADGSVLVYLIGQFYDNKTEENLKAVLQCLRDSKVWIPMKEGKVDILSNHDGAKFMPVFSQKEQIPDEYADEITVEQMSFTETIDYVINAVETAGIVVDPFTQSMIIDTDLIGYVMGLSTQLED